MAREHRLPKPPKHGSDAALEAYAGQWAEGADRKELPLEILRLRQLLRNAKVPETDIVVPRPVEETKSSPNKESADNALI